MLVLLLAMPTALATGFSPRPPAEEASAAPMRWSASPGIARIEARRLGRPILVLFSPTFRGGRLTSLMASPEMRPVMDRFVPVYVTEASGLAMIAPGATGAVSTQLLFVSPDGRLLKRMAGYIRPTDLREGVNTFDRLTRRRDRTPGERAERAASSGDLVSAQRWIDERQGADPDVAQLATTYGAVGDELLARGQMAEAIVAFERASELVPASPRQNRWRFRLAMARFRIGEMDAAIRDLNALAADEHTEGEDRAAVDGMLARITGPGFGR